MMTGFLTDFVSLFKTEAKVGVICVNKSFDFSRVAVVGLGYVGLSIASVLAQRGIRVYGIDRSEDIVAKVNAGICPIREPGMDELVRNVVTAGKLTAHTGADVIRKSGVIIMAVGTPLEHNYQPDTNQLMGSLDDIAPFLTKGQAIVIKSTVPPGMTRKVAEYLAEKTGMQPGTDLSLACCPERLAEGRVISDIEAIPVIVGGLTEKNTREIAAFWAVTGWKVIMVSGPEEAEMSKLADNLWIDLNIAMANELSMVCHRLNIDVLEVINAANTLPKGMEKVNILFPGPGVGGSCLVKDPWFLHHLAMEKGLSLKLPSEGRKINDGMPGFILQILVEGLSRNGLKIDGAIVTVLGLSFKQNTGDTRFSPTIPLVKLLSAAGARVIVHDPWVNPDKASELMRGLARVEMDLQAAVLGCDAVVFMAGHPEFQKSAGDWKLLAGTKCLMLDCRYIFDPVEMAGAGLNYLAPGRRILSGVRKEREICKKF